MPGVGVQIFHRVKEDPKACSSRSECGSLAATCHTDPRHVYPHVLY